MKTSNKILLGLLLCVFTVTLALFMTISNKIKQNDFTTRSETIGRQEYLINTALQPCKIVKLKGTSNVMKCNLLPADNGSYTYYKPNKDGDSIKVYQLGDTLFVQYVDVKENAESENNPRITETSMTHLGIDLHLPYWEELEIDQAIAFIDSTTLPGAQKMVTVKNNGALMLGSLDNTLLSYTGNMLYNHTVVDTVGKRLGAFSITAQQGTINVFTSQVNKMTLDLHANSTIWIGNKAVIDTLTGQIDAHSTLNGSAKNVRRLTALAKE